MSHCSGPNDSVEICFAWTGLGTKLIFRSFVSTFACNLSFSRKKNIARYVRLSETSVHMLKTLWENIVKTLRRGSSSTTGVVPRL